MGNLKDGAIAVVDVSADLAMPGASLLRRAWSTMTGLNDRAVNEEIERQLCDVVDELERKTRWLADQLEALGQRVDQLEAVQGVSWVTRLTTALRDADGAAKRRALLDLFARQTDPRIGSRAERRHWWDLLVALNDIDVQIIEHAALDEDLSMTLRHVVEDHRRSEGRSRVYPIVSRHGSRCVLTDYGKLFWEAIKPIEPAAAELAGDDFDDEA